MRVTILLSLGVCVILGSNRAATAQVRGPSEPLTESAALRRLADRDPQIRAIRARVDEVRAAQAGRVLRANPTFSVSRESVGDVRDDFLLARQEIDISGRIGRLREAGTLSVRVAEADARHAVTQRQAALRDAFTSALLAQHRIAAIESGIREMQQLLDVLRARETGGEGSSYDRMRGQRALADLDADLGLALAARAEAYGGVAAFIGQPALESANVIGALDALPMKAEPAALVAEALANRGDIQAAQAAVDQYRAERRAAERLGLPVPTLSGGLKRSTIADESRSGYLLSLDLTVPLFNRGQSVVALANAQGHRTEVQVAALKQQIEAEVRAAHASLAAQAERVQRYRAATAETQDSLASVARVGYEEGELGILELLDAVRQTLDGRLRLLEFAAAARRAAIELDRAIGREIQP